MDWLTFSRQTVVCVCDCLCVLDYCVIQSLGCYIPIYGCYFLVSYLFGVVLQRINKYTPITHQMNRQLVIERLRLLLLLLLLFFCFDF